MATFFSMLSECQVPNKGVLFPEAARNARASQTLTGIYLLFTVEQV